MELRSILLSYLASQGITGIKNIEIFSPRSRVNFFLKGTYQDKEVLIKTNFLGRSILYGFEQYVADRSKAVGMFKQFLYEPYKNIPVYNMTGERQSYNLAHKLDVETPALVWGDDKVLILEYSANGDLERLIEDGEFEAVYELTDMLLSSFYKRKYSYELIVELSRVPRTVHLTNFTDKLSTEEIDFLDRLPTNPNTIVHGDLKPNNILHFSDGSLRMIDMNFQVGDIHHDIGKFVTRILLNALQMNDKEHLAKAVVLCQKICRRVGEYTDIYIDEKKLLYFGFIEAKVLAYNQPRVAEYHLLGRELETIRANKEMITQVIDGLLQGKILYIEDIKDILGIS